MATRIVTYKTSLMHRPFARAFVLKRDALVSSLTPRPCIVKSVGLILAGLSIPLLMLLEIISTTLLLAFVGLALASLGGVLLLVNTGEI